MRCNLYNVLYYYQRCTRFWRFFRTSSGAYKTVCAALGIVMLSCCLPLVWLGSNLTTPAAGVVGLEPNHTNGIQQESMTIPKAAHTVLSAPADVRKNRQKRVQR
jgi:hypothetical protein